LIDIRAMAVLLLLVWLHAGRWWSAPP